jgi:hypothetical protein
MVYLKQRSQKSIKPPALISILVIFAASAQAFDVWGFQDQQSISQATSVAAQLGYTIALDDHKEPFRTVGFYRSAKEADAGLGYVGSFCNDRLMYISQLTKGTMGNFVDGLQDLKPIYGKPSIDTSSVTLAPGRYRWLQLEFTPKPKDKVAVMVRTTPGSETDFRVEVSHGAGDGCR